MFPPVSKMAETTGSAKAAVSESKKNACEAALCSALLAGDGRGAIAAAHHLQSLPLTIGECGASPLHVACRKVKDKKHLKELLPLLRTKGCRLLQRCYASKPEGQLPVLTPMHEAVGAENLNAIAVLAKMNAMCLNNGLPDLMPLHYAAHQNKAKSIVCLVSCGAVSGLQVAMRWLICVDKAASLAAMLKCSSEARRMLRSMKDAVFVACASGAPNVCSLLLQPRWASHWRSSLGSGPQYDTMDRRHTSAIPIVKIACPVQPEGTDCLAAAASHLARTAVHRRHYGNWLKRLLNKRFVSDDQLATDWSMRTANTVDDTADWLTCPPYQGREVDQRYAQTIHVLAKAMCRDARKMRTQRRFYHSVLRVFRTKCAHVGDKMLENFVCPYIRPSRPFEHLERAVVALDLAFQAGHFLTATALLQHGANPYGLSQLPVRWTTLPGLLGRRSKNIVETRKLRKSCHACLSANVAGWCPSCSTVTKAIENAVFRPMLHRGCLARVLEPNTTFFDPNMKCRFSVPMEGGRGEGEGTGKRVFEPFVVRTFGGSGRVPLLFRSGSEAEAEAEDKGDDGTKDRLLGEAGGKKKRMKKEEAEGEGERKRRTSLLFQAPSPSPTRQSSSSSFSSSSTTGRAFAAALTSRTPHHVQEVVEPTIPALFAAEHRAWPAVQRLVLAKTNLDLRYRDSIGLQLVRACASHVPTLQFLFRRGGKNVVTVGMQTCIVENNSISLRNLVEAKAEVDAPLWPHIFARDDQRYHVGKDGRAHDLTKLTPLSLAIFYGCEQIQSILETAGAHR